MGEVVAKALADTHPDLEHVADSPYLRDIVRLDELMEQAAKTNPNTRENRKAVKEGALSAEAVQERHQELTDEIDRLTAPYLETGYLRKNTAKFSYGSEIGVAAAKSLQSFFTSAAGNHTMDVLRGLGINPQSQSYRANLLETRRGPCPARPSSSPERLSQPRDYFEQLIAAHGGKATWSHFQIHLLPPGRQRRRLQTGQGPQAGRSRHLRGRLQQAGRGIGRHPYPTLFPIDATESRSLHHAAGFRLFHPAGAQGKNARCAPSVHPFSLPWSV